MGLGRMMSQVRPEAEAADAAPAADWRSHLVTTPETPGPGLSSLQQTGNFR